MFESTVLMFYAVAAVIIGIPPTMTAFVGFVRIAF
jgi:hypothetical protein